MDNNSRPETKPNPDPTVYTNEAIERAVKGERDYVDGLVDKLEQRFAGLDEATKLTRADVEKIPKSTRRSLDNQKELIYVELKAINDKLIAIEQIRLEQKQDSKEGLAAALTAAKEAVSEQNKSNTESIKKSEAATNETIKANQESGKAITDGLTKSLDELKLVVNSVVSAQGARTDTITDARHGRADNRGGVAIVGTVIASVVAVFALLFASFSNNNTSTDNNGATVICTESYHPTPCP